MTENKVTKEILKNSTVEQLEMLGVASILKHLSESFKTDDSKKSGE